VAHTLSAKKRVRQTEKRRVRNKAYKSAMRTAVKKFYSALEAGDKDAMDTAYNEAIVSINKTGGKGVIHKNEASRRVSRLTAKLNAAKA